MGTASVSLGELPGLGHLSFPGNVPGHSRTEWDIFPPLKSPLGNIPTVMHLMEVFLHFIFAFHFCIFGFGFGIHNPDSPRIFAFPKHPCVYSLDSLWGHRHSRIWFYEVSSRGICRLEKPSQSSKSNPAKATTNPCPQAPHPPFQDGNSSASLGSLFQKKSFPRV